jgi:hypothetical protein
MTFKDKPYKAKATMIVGFEDGNWTARELEVVVDFQAYKDNGMAGLAFAIRDACLQKLPRRLRSNQGPGVRFNLLETWEEIEDEKKQD